MFSIVEKLLKIEKDMRERIRNFQIEKFETLLVVSRFNVVQNSNLSNEIEIVDHDFSKNHNNITALTLHGSIIISRSLLVSVAYANEAEIYIRRSTFSINYRGV